MLIDGNIFDLVDGRPRYEVYSVMLSNEENKYSYMMLSSAMKIFDIHQQGIERHVKACKLVDLKTGITLRQFGYRRLEQHLTESGAHE